MLLNHNIERLLEEHGHMLKVYDNDFQVKYRKTSSQKKLHVMERKWRQAAISTANAERSVLADATAATSNALKQAQN